MFVTSEKLSSLRPRTKAQHFESSVCISLKERVQKCNSSNKASLEIFSCLFSKSWKMVLYVENFVVENCNGILSFIILED